MGEIHKLIIKEPFPSNLGHWAGESQNNYAGSADELDAETCG